MEYTPNYQLPLYTDNDVTSYMTIYNETMSDIDTALHDINTKVVKTDTDITALESQVETNTQTISTMAETVSDNSTAISGLQSRASGTDQSITALQVALQTTNEKLDNVSNAVEKVYRGTLSSGEKTLAITIGEFGSNTLVDVYSSVYGVNPLTIELRAATGGQPNLCVTTWDVQTEDVNVAVSINNTEGV